MRCRPSTSGHDETANHTRVGLPVSDEVEMVTPSGSSRVTSGNAVPLATAGSPAAGKPLPRSMITAATTAATVITVARQATSVLTRRARDTRPRSARIVVVVLGSAGGGFVGQVGERQRTLGGGGA